MRSILLVVIICSLVLTGADAAESLVTGGPYFSGDLIQIYGDTNYNTENRILVEVYPASFGPAAKYESTMYGGNTQVVPVTKTNAGGYAWNATMNTTGWKPDQYMVRIEVIGKDFRETSLMTLSEKKPVSKPESPAPETQTSAVHPPSAASPEKQGIQSNNETREKQGESLPATPLPTGTQIPEPTRKSPLSPMIVIGSLLVIGSMALLSRK